MSPEQAWQWQINLQLRLRQIHGDAFQEFFSEVMSRAHGDDYIRVRAFGSLGDKGCDGYLLSVGSLFQCYGKLEDAGVSSGTIVKKIKDDFDLAKANFGDVMKQWTFVHNLTNGLPAEAVLALEAIRKAHEKITVSTMGPEGFEVKVFSTPEPYIARLLGPVGTAEQTRNMRIEEVAEIIDSVMRGLELELGPTTSPKPVPFDKMEFNAIPGAWRTMLQEASRNAAYVDDYLELTTDPELGRKLALAFRSRYQKLKIQHLAPRDIMAKLYEDITGLGSVSLERQIAAQALLAFLFESCDIFEDDPAEVKS